MSKVHAAIRTHGGTEPPTCDLSFVRNEHRRLAVVVTGIPQGLTLAKLVWDAKVSASDPDTATTFQKVITTTSAIATVGQITDAGTLGVARATASFTPSDTVNWPATASHQLWAVLSDGNPYRCLTGTVRSATPIPLTLTTVASLTFAPSPVSISGSPGTTQSVTVTAKDAGGTAVVGVSIALASNDTGVVTVSPASAVTDASGVATFTLTMVAAGSTTVTASAGAITASDPVTTTANALPPAGANLAWAFDVAFAGASQTPASRVGPAGQLGSTAGADTNDPTYQAGPPARYAFAPSQYVTFFDALDAVWTDPTGFTVMVGVDYEAADTGRHATVTKAAAAGAEFSLELTDGKPYVEIYDNAGGITGYELFTATTPLTAGRRVVTYRYDPSRPRGSRVSCFVAGVLAPGTSSTSGTATAIGDTATALHLGARADNAVPPPTAIGNVYAWPGALSDADILTNADWLATTMGWA